MAQGEHMNGAAEVAPLVIKADGTPLLPGYYVVGTLLGRKPVGTWTPADSQTARPTLPKLGVKTGMGVVTIAAESESAIDSALRGVVKGDTIAVAVQIRPPFGAQGPLKVALLGTADGDGGWK
jgi:hypothetical protein